MKIEDDFRKTTGEVDKHVERKNVPVYSKAKEEMIREIRRYCVMNENGNMTPPHLRGVRKAVLGGKRRAPKGYINKEWSESRDC